LVKWVALIIIAITSSVITFMMSAVNVAVPMIGKEFEMEAVLLGWVVTAMTLPQALLWAARGEREKALKLINDKEPLNEFVTSIFIFLGMKDEAIRTIEEGIERGFEVRRQYLYSYPLLAKNSIFKSLRSEPRYQEILRREKAKYKEKLRTFAWP